MAIPSVAPASRIDPNVVHPSIEQESVMEVDRLIEAGPTLRLSALGALLAIALLATGPAVAKDYGFNRVNATPKASAIANGWNANLCTDADDHSATYMLTLSAGDITEVTDILNAGGAVSVEIHTQHTYIGTGNTSHNADIVVTGGGGATLGSFTDASSASSPVNQVNNRQFQRFVTASDIQGGTMMVVAAGIANADMGALCGQGGSAQSKWKTAGVILRTTP